MARILGIDYGTKKVGIAVSDEAGQFAFPEAILANDPELMKAISTLIGDNRVAEVVIGASIDYHGNENPVMEEAKAFVQKLKDATGVTVSFSSEILTSAQARRQFENDEKTRKEPKRELVDASAAALILDSYLQERRRAAN